MNIGSPHASPSQPVAPRPNSGGQRRLLVVDDEPVLAELLLDSLTFSGYDVHVATTGSEAINSVHSLRPDLIVLDVNLPDFNGFVVAARLRAAGDNTPIVFLTARDAPTDLRDGFGAGGDDYLTKPFRLEELRLRIEAILRRTVDPAGKPATTVTVGALVLDLAAKRAWRGGTPLDLSPIEFKLLEHLAIHPNKVYTATDLRRRVWGDSPITDDSAVHYGMSQLRAKLGAKPDMIDNVAGHGYVLRTSKS